MLPVVAVALRILIFLSSEAVGQECFSQMEPTCMTTWSEWTSCLSPFTEPIDEGVAKHKAEVNTRQCSVPQYFWAATLDSKMMKDRRNIQRFRDQQGFGPRQIVTRKRKNGDGARQKDIICAPDQVPSQVRDRFKLLVAERAKSLYHCKAELTKGLVDMPNKFLERVKALDEHLKMDSVEDICSDFNNDFFLDALNKQMNGEKSWRKHLQDSPAKTKATIESVLHREKRSPEQPAREEEGGFGMPNLPFPIPIGDEKSLQERRAALLEWKANILTIMSQSLDMSIMALTNVSFYEEVEQNLDEGKGYPKWIQDQTLELTRLSNASVERLSKTGILNETMFRNVLSNVNPCSSQAVQVPKFDERMREQVDNSNRCPVLEELFTLTDNYCPKTARDQPPGNKQGADQEVDDLQLMLAANCKGHLDKGAVEMPPRFYVLFNKISDLSELANVTLSNNSGAVVPFKKPVLPPEQLKALRKVMVEWKYNVLQLLNMSIDLNIMMMTNRTFYTDIIEQAMSGNKNYQPPWFEKQVTQVEVLSKRSMELMERAQSIDPNLEERMDSFNPCDSFTQNANTGRKPIGPEACDRLYTILDEQQNQKKIKHMFPERWNMDNAKTFQKLADEKSKLLYYCQSQLSGGTIEMPPEFFTLLNKFDDTKQCQYSPGLNNKIKREEISTKRKTLEQLLHGLSETDTDTVFTSHNDPIASGSPFDTIPNETEMARRREFMLQWKTVMMEMMENSIDMMLLMTTNATVMQDLKERSNDPKRGNPPWMLKYSKQMERRSQLSLELLNKAGMNDPSMVAFMSTVSPCGTLPANVNIDSKQSIATTEQPMDEAACTKLYQYLQLAEEVENHRDLAKQRCTDGKKAYEQNGIKIDGDNAFDYEMHEMSNPPTAGCGFCARRIRCCKDNSITWLDQKAESEVCEEYSSACEVEPLADGTCDYNKYIPDHFSDKLYDSSNSRNKLLANKLETKIQNKWMQLLGSSIPMLQCTLKDGLCFCCCGNYTAAESSMGPLVCRRNRKQTPGPSTTARPESGNRPQRVQVDVETEYSAVVAAGIEEVINKWTTEIGNRLGINPARIQDMTIQPGGSIILSFTIKPDRPSTSMLNTVTAKQTVEKLAQLIQSNAKLLTDQDGNELAFLSDTLASSDFECSTNEMYKDCGNGCESTCTSNPKCPDMCSADMAGCYCEPGKVRKGFSCVEPAVCANVPSTKLQTTIMPTKPPTSITDSSSATAATTAGPFGKICKNTWNYPEDCTDDCVYSVTHSVSLSGTITFDMSVKKMSKSYWFGIGFNKNNEMDKADALLVAVQKGEFRLEDRILGYYKPGRMDKIQNGKLLVATERDDWIDASFERKCSTGDKEDVDLCDGTEFYFMFPFSGGPMTSRGPGKHISSPKVIKWMSLKPCISGTDPDNGGSGEGEVTTEQSNKDTDTPDYTNETEQSTVPVTEPAPTKPKPQASTTEPRGDGSTTESDSKGSTTEPEGSTAEPKGSTAEPEGSTAEPEPEGSTGEPEPEGSTAEPEPEGSTAEPEPEGSTAEPEPEGSTAEPEPEGSTAEPEPEGSTSEPEPEGSTAEPEPEVSTAEPESEGSTVEPEPEGSTAEPEPEGSTVEPEPEGSTAEPEPEGSTVEPEPEGSTVEPEPEGSTAEPEPEGSTAEPEPEGSTAEPEPEGSTVEPEPEGSTVEPEPEGSTAEPEPGGSTAESEGSTAEPKPEGSTAESEGSTAEPEPEGSTAEPEPEGSTVEPEPEGSTAEPEPGGSTAESEGSTAEPEPEGSTAEPEPEGSTAEPEPEGSTVEPEPEGSTAEPEGSTAEPEPEGSTAEREPEGSTAEPEPEGSTVEPEPEGSTAEPEPEGSTVEPEPEGSTAEPESERSTAEPEGSTAEPEPEGSTAEPEPEGSTVEPEPEGSTAEPEPEGSTVEPEAEGSTVEPDAKPKPTKCFKTWTGPPGCKGHSCTYKVKTKLTKDNTVEIDLTIERSGTDFWTGVGFSKNSKMANADVLLLIVHGDNVKLEDRKLGPGYSPGTVDENQNSQLIHQKWQKNRLEAKIRRPCETNDSSDLNLCGTDPFYWLFPYSGGPLTGENQISMHTSTPAIVKSPPLSDCEDQKKPKP